MPPRRPAAAATAATAAASGLDSFGFCLAIAQLPLMPRRVFVRARATEVRFQRRGDIYYWSAVVEILYSTAWRCTLL